MLWILWFCRALRARLNALYQAYPDKPERRAEGRIVPTQRDSSNGAGAALRRGRAVSAPDDGPLEIEQIDGHRREGVECMGWRFDDRFTTAVEGSI